MAAQTVNRMVSAAVMFAVGIAIVSAGADKRLLLLIKHSTNPEINISYSIVVQHSGNFDPVGTSDVVNSSNRNQNVRRIIAIDSVEGGKFEKTCEDLLENPATNPRAAFVAELTDTENSSIVPPVDDIRWHRIYLGIPTLGNATHNTNMYYVQLKICDRLVFFAPVNKFGDAVDLHNTGVAIFNEISRDIYLKEEDAPELPLRRIFGTPNFDYKQYWKLGQMIAVQYDKDNNVTASKDGDWMYYKFISKYKTPGFRVVRVLV